MTHSSGRSPLPVRPDWLATWREPILDPGQPIIDAHHHLYDRPGNRYLLDDLLADIGSEGHDVKATVYVQARAMLRADGPESMRAVGETEFANGAAAMAASGTYGSVRACAGIVGFADLRLGEAVVPVLEAHRAAAGFSGRDPGRFRGIRQIAVWDPEPSMSNAAYATTEDMLDEPSFRAGFARLAPLGLSFDAWVLFHQLHRLSRLARDFPETTIVVDHCGGVAGIGPYAGRRDSVFSAWTNGVAELAQCPNVSVKLGGLGMSLSGFGFDSLPTAPSSESLARAWRPYFEALVEAFGTSRCMFESNFPVDKGSYAYHVGWNTMKRLASGFTEAERQDLFWRSAARIYRLAVPGLDAA